MYSVSRSMSMNCDCPWVDLDDRRKCSRFQDKKPRKVHDIGSVPGGFDSLVWPSPIRRSSDRRAPTPEPAAGAVADKSRLSSPLSASLIRAENHGVIRRMGVEMPNPRSSFDGHGKAATERANDPVAPRYHSPFASVMALTGAGFGDQFEVKSP
jgi:hypothetical protein